MIEKVTAFKASDGQIFNSIEAVQVHELVPLIQTVRGDLSDSGIEAVATSLVENKNKVLDILTTTPRSKPRARSINGGKKNRTPKSTPQTAAA